VSLACLFCQLETDHLGPDELAQWGLGAGVEGVGAGVCGLGVGELRPEDWVLDGRGWGLGLGLGWVPGNKEL
jgi:hypothetical protein